MPNSQPPVRRSGETEKTTIPTLSESTRSTKHDNVSGVMRAEITYVNQCDGTFAPISRPRVQGIPLAAIALLDLANSSDFPANVFNDIPVPTFAAVLMGIGGTFAATMFLVALIDARKSWQAICILRQERRELAMRGTDTSRPHYLATAALEHLNFRDLATEIFERLAVELLMGISALLISVGTYMAIGGADPNVFLASNLLSGYIGNAPGCLFGVTNVFWSAAVWLRVHRQRRAAQIKLKAGPVASALQNRAAIVQRHAVTNGFCCLGTGALGVVTAAQLWQPYPFLLAFGLLFVYTLYIYRQKIAYERPMLSRLSSNFVLEDLIGEIAQLLDLESIIKVQKKQNQNPFELDGSSPDSLTKNLELILSFDLFEDLCRRVFAETRFVAALSSRMRETASITPADLSALDTELHPELNKICQRCVTERAQKQVSLRLRFLLELLGSHLITFGSGCNKSDGA